MLISDNIKKLDNIWTPTKVLKNFYLSLYLQKNAQAHHAQSLIVSDYNCRAKPHDWQTRSSKRVEYLNHLIDDLVQGFLTHLLWKPMLPLTLARLDYDKSNKKKKFKQSAKSCKMQYSRKKGTLLTCQLSLRTAFTIKTHLLFLNRFEYLDYAPFTAVDIYALKNFTVFSPSNFPHNLIIILITVKKAENFLRNPDDH